MAKKIFIDRHCGNIFSALTDNDKMIEYHMEKQSQNDLVGNIYKGKVECVLNGMQAAFVNVGCGRNGYLNVSEMLIDKSELEDKMDVPTKLNLKVGDEIPVQIVKDATGCKGVRCSTILSFAGFYLVYLPILTFVGVSRKITDVEKRAELLSIVEKIKCEGGFIVRTRAEQATKKEIKQEAQLLIKKYKSAMEKYKQVSAPSLVHEEGDLSVRMLRDVYSRDVEKIIIGEQETYDKLVFLANKRKDELRSKLVFFDKNSDMFSYYGLVKEVEKFLRNRVDLQSGAYIIIDRTEALTAIDVNTGKFTGGNSLEDTVYQTNLLATDEIARQVRLRNIGGIIIVDYIDMECAEHRENVLSRLEAALKEDRAKCNIIGMSTLGLVEFTRKKKRKRFNVGSTMSLLQRRRHCNVGRLYSITN